MSKLSVIDGKKSLAGAVPGDKIVLVHTTGKITTIVLDSYTSVGITGFNVNLLDRPLTFYPFHNILEIKKTK